MTYAGDAPAIYHEIGSYVDDLNAVTYRNQGWNDVESVVEKGYGLAFEDGNDFWADFYSGSENETYSFWWDFYSGFGSEGED